MVELLAKIADSEELLLYEFHASLIRCGFNISEEEVAASHEKMHSEGRIIEQLKKLFRVYGCSAEEQHLLIQTSTIPGVHFVFDQAKKWFGLHNRTLLNRLEKRGWLKKEALYDNGRNRYASPLWTAWTTMCPQQIQSFTASCLTATKPKKKS